jgi:hypothetical protein
MGLLDVVFWILVGAAGLGALAVFAVIGMIVVTIVAKKAKP